MSHVTCKAINYKYIKMKIEEYTLYLLKHQDYFCFYLILDFSNKYVNVIDFDCDDNILDKYSIISYSKNFVISTLSLNWDKVDLKKVIEYYDFEFYQSMLKLNHNLYNKALNQKMKTILN